MPRRDAAGRVSLQSRALDSGQSRPAGADRSLFSTVAVAGSTPADAPQAVAALRTAVLRLAIPCRPPGRSAKPSRKTPPRRRHRHRKMMLEFVTGMLQVPSPVTMAPVKRNSRPVAPSAAYRLRGVPVRRSS